MQLTLLGTGDVRQVPVYGCECRACQNARQNLALRRKPCSALLESGDLRLLIDGGLTDLCERFQPGQLSGILLTHYHMDHIQGLFHLRWGVNDHIPVYGPEDGGAAGDLKKHPGILEFLPPLTAFEPFSPQADLSITPIPMQHSKPTFGYLIEQDGKRIAYLTDTVGLPEASEEYLKQFDLDVVVIDTSVPPQPQPPRNHNDLNLSLAIFKALKPKKMILTHLGHEMDEWLLDNELPYGEIKVAMDNSIHHV
ncbi:phosphonate metabolism protein PhnP [Pontibacterium sp.]|uniref:phosphonate metabolism protein PhnP n=1 Tax=Pontibacterium sp. TaxID=2036026 RepID=UPI0035121640